MKQHSLTGIVLGVVALGLCGCGRDSVSRDVAAMNPDNIRRVANMYAAYQNYRGGVGPADEQDFKSFIKGFMPENLKMMGIDPANVDKIFTSERDGKPLKVRYKVSGGRGAVAPVAFEQEGKDGKRQVAFTGGKVQETDDSSYAQLWAGKTAPPDPASAPPSGRPAAAPPPPKK